MEDKIYGLKALVRAHQLLHFLINSKLNMASFVNIEKVVVRKRAFSTFPSA
jgi:hypothetical protein